MTRIALVHYSSPPVIGGVEFTIAAHARLLAEHGYPVQVIAGRGSSFDPRVRVRVIPALSSTDPLVLAAHEELARGEPGEKWRELREMIHSALVPALAEVDICIAHNVATLHKNLALTTVLHELAASGQLGLIAWSHDFAWDDPLYASQLHPGLPWELLHRPWPGTRYVVVSQSRRRVLAHLLDVPESEILVVPPGIHPYEFLQIGDRVRGWADQFGLLGAQPLMLLPARVTRRKNIEQAIEITAALRDLASDPRLVVMGPLGPHNPKNREYLDELCARRQQLGLEREVVFMQEHGPVDDGARRDLYALADLLVFPSKSEGFGIPLLEAGLACLPVWCADIPPFHEIAGPVANYIPLDESPFETAGRIAQSLENDARYQWKQRVLREFSWDMIFARHIEPLIAESEP